MPHTFLRALGTLALAATSLTALPAAAAGRVTVTSPSCGTLVVRNGTTTDQMVGIDDGTMRLLGPGQSSRVTGLRGGQYTWGVQAMTGTSGRGVATVATCAGSRPRPARGDISGDGIADVLGVATNGDLYYYRMTPRGLADGVKVGNGWGSTVWMQRVEGWANGRDGRRVVAVRSDGSVWRYDELGGGRLGDGKKIGQGFGSFTAFTVIPANNGFLPGANLFMATKDGTAGAWALVGDQMIGEAQADPEVADVTRMVGMQDFDGDRFADLLLVDTRGDLGAASTVDVPVTPVSSGPVGSERKVGFGWGTTAMLASPGSFETDQLSDLIGRRTDGGLYRYRNAGGRWDTAQRIGQRWFGIRLLA